jgi:hypothetical protein
MLKSNLPTKKSGQQTYGTRNQNRFVDEVFGSNHEFLIGRLFK